MVGRLRRLNPRRSAIISSLASRKYASAGLLLVVLAATLRFRDCVLPWLFDLMVVLGMWFCFLDVVMSIFRAQAPNEPSEWRKRATQLLVEIFVALGIGAAMVLLLKPDRAFEKPDHAFERSELPQELAKALGIAVLILGAEVIAQSTGKLLEFADTSNKMKMIVHDMEEKVAHGHYAGLAAKAIGIRNEWLEINSKPDGVLVESLESALSSIKTWVRLGHRLGANGEGPESSARRLAWWRAMAIYHQEEVFDVGRSEFATNVRNYAFILIGLISAFLRSLQVPLQQKEDEEDKGESLEQRMTGESDHPARPKKRLVVLQVTPFTPKDFFNFPNGTSSRRFYHEAEYFGTYRRVLSVIVADPRVIAARVLLVGEDPRRPGHNVVSEGRRDLGWELEPMWNVMLDCARVFTVPMPVTFSTIHADSAAMARCDDGVNRDIKQQLMFRVGDTEDPTKVLPARVTRALWAPTYVFGGCPRHMDRDYLEWEAIRLSWLERCKSINEVDFTRLKVSTDLWRKYLGEAGFDESGISYHAREREAWLLLLRAFRDCVIVDNSRRRDDQIAVIDRYVIERARAGSPGGSLRSLLGNDHLNEVVDLEEFLGDLSKLWSRREECYHLQNELAKGAMGEERVLLLHERHTDAVLGLVAHCQASDARFQSLQGENLQVAYSMSSAGTELGFVENWLHRFLIVLEATKRRAEILKRGPLPVWQLFLADLFGRGMQREREHARGSKEDNMAVQEFLRVIPLNAESSKEMSSKGISPEFLLIGVCDEREEFDPTVGVDWMALVRAEISEPFHTCRVSIDFDQPGYLEHVEWLKNQWPASAATTESFLSQLSREATAVED
jgi:hypothetical protein